MIRIKRNCICLLVKIIFQQIRVKSGTGLNSRDGYRGVGNCQMHMINRLLFGCERHPEAEYNLSVMDLTETGRLLLNILDKASYGDNLPGTFRFVKNDLNHFIKRSYRELLYFYCPYGMTGSVQYLSFGK